MLATLGLGWSRDDKSPRTSVTSNSASFKEKALSWTKEEINCQSFASVCWASKTGAWSIIVWRRGLEKGGFSNCLGGGGGGEG